MSGKKIFFLLLFAGALLVFFLCGGARYLSLPAIQASINDFHTYNSEHAILAPAIFFLIYIFVTAFSIPGAAVITLLGGALFGLIQGVLLVSFASSIGATLAFFSARYVLRASMERSFANWLQKINQGLERDGAFYLLSLRLIPAVPFFIVNIVMGITQMPAWRFYLVSQIGMLPATFAYVNAGRELAKIQSLHEILSPSLIMAFIALGLLPWIGKGMILAWRFLSRMLHK